MHNFETGKIVLQGNMKLLTKHIQFKTGKAKSKILFIGEHIFDDIFATCMFNQTLKDEFVNLEIAKAKWETIAIIPDEER